MDSEKEVYRDDLERSKSALQHNIESKGNNAYYFAHAFKANGPVWDGKPEPRLLSKSESSLSLDAAKTAESEGVTHHTVSGVRSSFDYAKSTITKYGFLDEGSKVRVYIEIPGVGDSHTDEQVQLEYTERSICLKIVNENARDDYLSFGKLYGCIDKATVKLKKDRIVVTLYKRKTTCGDGENTEENDDAYDEWKTIAAQANLNAEEDYSDE